MSFNVVDYSWARPDVGCLRDAGVVGVMRYINGDGKKFSVDEVNVLHGNGLWVGLNHEGWGDWREFSSGAQGGLAAGAADAVTLKSYGCPYGNVSVFCSADYGAQRSQWGVIESWLQGYQVGVGRRVSFYGQGDLGSWLLSRGSVGYVWQTNAHAWGGVCSSAVIFQQDSCGLCGGDVDTDVLVGDPSQWAWMPSTFVPVTPLEDDMTPEQSAQLSKVADLADRIAEWCAQADGRVGIMLSWMSVGGVQAGIERVYKSRLGRDVDPAGLETWEKFSASHTFEQFDAAVAGSPEGKRWAAAHSKV